MLKKKATKKNHKKKYFFGWCANGQFQGHFTQMSSRTESQLHKFLTCSLKYPFWGVLHSPCLHSWFLKLWNKLSYPSHCLKFYFWKNQTRTLYNASRNSSVLTRAPFHSGAEFPNHYPGDQSRSERRVDRKSHAGGTLKSWPRKHPDPIRLELQSHR